MRLDLFLKSARLVKRRTVAQTLCESGRVSVNGRATKPAKEVRPGDVVALRFSSRSIELEVVATRDEPSNRKLPPEALYRITAETRIAGEEDLWNENRS